MDPPRSAYPVTLSRSSRISRPLCRVCDFYPATKVTYFDFACGDVPGFFCPLCFESFHGNVAGEEVDAAERAGHVAGRDFFVYDFVHAVGKGG